MRDYKYRGLPLLKRRRGSHPRLIWYTNDQLLNLWQVTVVKHQREQILAGADSSVSRSGKTSD